MLSTGAAKGRSPAHSLNSSFKGGNDKNALLTYINQVLVPNLWEGACVVMGSLRTIVTILHPTENCYRKFNPKQIAATLPATQISP